MSHSPPTGAVAPFPTTARWDLGWLRTDRPQKCPYCRVRADRLALDGGPCAHYQGTYHADQGRRAADLIPRIPRWTRAMAQSFDDDLTRMRQWWLFYETPPRQVPLEAR